MANNKNPHAIRKRNKILGPIVAIAIILGFLLIGLTGFLVIKSEIDGNRALGEFETIVEVPEGSSMSAIAELLSENKVINSSLVFNLYVKLTGNSGNVQFGPHQVNSGMAYPELIEALETPFIVEVEGVSITFREGRTALGMALDLEEQGFFTVQEFVDECNNGTFTGNVFPLISDNPDKFIKLEGFLFPETYMYYEEMSINAFIQQMLDTFELRVMTEENMALIEEGDLSLEEVVILSSIVEKEAVGVESYAMVASVFFNRLNNPDVFPTLDTDTSSDWVRRELPSYGGFFPGVLEYYYGSYDAIPDATKAGYDTFLRPGLPIGAICNPGQIAIEGVLSPADTPYYFFFTGADKETFYWNETLAGHVSDWNLYGGE